MTENDFYYISNVSRRLMNELSISDLECLCNFYSNKIKELEGKKADYFVNTCQLRLELIQSALSSKIEQIFGL